MKVLITAVGQRTEHWVDLFAVLARQPDLEITAVVADVSPLTIDGLSACSGASLRHVHLRHVMSESRTGHMASIVFSPRALRTLRIDRPDVIHVIGEPAYLSTAQIVRWRNRRAPGVPITHFAAQNVVTRFPYPFPVLERRAYRAIAHAVPITPAALNVLRAKGFGGTASVVPLGVDTSRFTPSRHRSERRFTVGFVGRLEPHKGVADLVEAAARVDSDLLVIGRGSLAGLVKSAATARPGRVRLLDWVDHEILPGMFADMDALALPSTHMVQRNVVRWVGIPLREQFGRVLVEAMACGVPVVGSDVGEIPHVVGDAGLIYPEGDVAALADRLAAVRDEPGLARRLAHNGILRSSNEFSWDSIARRMHDIWTTAARTAAMQTAAARRIATEDKERVTRP